MRTELCELLGIDVPIVGFSPSEHVVAAVSRAGGLGVLGCVRFNDPAELDAVLSWLDTATGGRPYGVDVVMPSHVPTEGAPADLDELIPPGHKDFVERTLLRLGVPPLGADDSRRAGVLGWLHSVARSHVEVALTHPVRLIANALGPPPPDVIAQAHDAGLVVAALAGRADHARSHVAAGVDLIVAQGYEAGGHTGEIGSMVLIPEVVAAVAGRAPVLAAGGIGSGRQIAAALALGAQGVWMGSVWLGTEEYRSGPALREALLRAGSGDTVRSRIYSGKPARLLRNRWTDAWEAAEAPRPLPMPLQNLLVSEAHTRLMESGDPTVVPMPVGQIVGRMNAVRPVADVVAELVDEAGLKRTSDSFAEAIAEAERIVAAAPHCVSEQDLVEGLDYLAGNIRGALQTAWAYDRDFPYFVRSTGPYTKMGLDNPDTLYFHAWLSDDPTYVVTGRRGTTADLSFQVLNGDYSPVDVPGSLTAFDDRELDIGPDGAFRLTFGPGLPRSAMLVVREVYSDWGTERPGMLRIERTDRIGLAPPAPTLGVMRKRYAVAGKMLVSRLRTFLAFAERFYLGLPVNTLTTPRPTPGGLSTQYSSVGHYELDDDQAMVVTVPASGAPYQGIQLGSMWYVSLDYVNHQTSLTAAQARIDPDGMIRYVISERDPGVANWLERTGHRRGYVQLRWQRLSRPLTAADGPRADIVAVDDLPKQLPYHEPIGADAWRARIAARQAAVAARMLG